MQQTRFDRLLSFFWDNIIKMVVWIRVQLLQQWSFFHSKAPKSSIFGEPRELPSLIRAYEWTLAHRRGIRVENPSTLKKMSKVSLKMYLCLDAALSGRCQKLRRFQRLHCGGWEKKDGSNAILAQSNRRLEFAKSFVNPRTQRFDNMYDYVHIDEKWFYMTKINTNYYLVPGETPPHRTCKSKRYITKVMFMCAVARPRWDSHAHRHFDGKIGIWPFTFEEPAKRSSKNRPAGTLETKCITSINRVEMTKMMVEKVIPAIKQKWPAGSKRCIIQQDNAKPHTNGGDNAIMQAMQHDRIRMELSNQPPNSPDFNSTGRFFLEQKKRIKGRFFLEQREYNLP